MKLWIVGLIVVIVGAFLNGLLVQLEIGGLIRELMRLVVLAGLGILVFGLFKRNSKS